MKASLVRLEDFFIDLKRLVDKGEKPYVRADAFTISVNDGVSQVSVKSSFFDKNENFYEYSSDCGEVWAGDTDPEAYRKAGDMINVIAERSVAMGCDFGRGEWQQ